MLYCYILLFGGLSMDGRICLGLADWHAIGRMVWDWQIGTELADWPEIGRLSWNWHLGTGLAGDWRLIGLLVLCWHWHQIDTGMEPVCDGFALDCHRICTALAVIRMDWQRIGTGLKLERHQLELSWHLIGHGFLLNLHWIGIEIGMDWHWIGMHLHQNGTR